jgi:hypothetical protein
MVRLSPESAKSGRQSRRIPRFPGPAPREASQTDLAGLRMLDCKT